MNLYSLGLALFLTAGCSMPDAPKRVEPDAGIKRYKIIDVDVQLPPYCWKISDISDTTGSHISLNNFNSNYLHMGIIPEGGAEIDIFTDTMKSKEIDAVIDEFLGGDKPLGIEDVTVSGCKAKQIDEAYNDLLPSYNMRRRAVFMPLRHGDSSILYKFFLRYRVGETGENSFNDTFSRILESTKRSAACGE